jgi:hypothetical protein
MRAELRLALVEAKAWLFRMLRSAVLLWLGLLLVQVLVALAAAGAVLLQSHGWQSVGEMLLIALVPTACVLVLFAREARKLRELSDASRDQAEQRNR